MSLVRRLLVAAVSMLAATSAVRAQPDSAAHKPAVAPAVHPITVYLMTMGMGDEVWELFGHNAIRVKDDTRGTDTAYNWGMFSFTEPGFIARFLTGDNHYWLEGFPSSWIVEGYRRRNRTITEQRLNLSDAQALALRDFIDLNARPENKFYRYDYYLDNCSTRVRDALDRVLGGQLQRALASKPTSTSYRWHTRRLMQGDVPLYTGIEVALGKPADRPISAWEESFLPVRLAAHVREISVTDSVGRAMPLVASEETLFQATRAPEPEQPPSRVPYYIVVGMALGALLAMLAVRAARASGGARTTLAIISTMWLALAGLLGVILTLAWTLTRHVFWYHNATLLQLTPIALLLAFALPAFIRHGRRAAFVVRTAQLLAALSLLGLVLEALPAFRQFNAEIIALALPMNFALAWGVQRLAHARVAA